MTPLYNLAKTDRTLGVFCMVEGMPMAVLRTRRPIAGGVNRPLDEIDEKEAQDRQVDFGNSRCSDVGEEGN